MLYKTVGELITKARVEKCGDGNYPVLSMTMHDGIVFQGDRFKKQIASSDQSTYNVARRNQLVISFPIDEGVLAVQDITDAGIVSPAYKIWDVDQTQVLPKYLEAFLRSPYSIQYYKSKLRGTTARRRSITDSDLLEMRLPLGTKKEQFFVLNTLERVKRIIGLRTQELQRLDDLVKARFVEMFGGYTDSVKLSEVSTVTGGLTKNSKRKSMPLKLPYLRVANVSFDNIDTSEMLEIGLTEEEKEKTLLKYGDLLFVEGNGSPDQIGRVAVWRDEIALCVHQNHLIKARFADADKEMLPVFAMHYFMTEKGRQQIKKKAVSTSGLYTLSVQKVADFSLPNPPLSEQGEFIAFVAQIDKSKSAVQKARDQAQVLFDSLMQQYFG